MINRRFFLLVLTMLPIVALIVFNSVLAALDDETAVLDSSHDQQMVSEIVLTKTVALDPVFCGLSDAIDIPAGTQVTYCYDVSNSGTVTLTQHELLDNELGSIFSDTYELVPGEAITVTSSVTIHVTTVNSATWTAYNPGPVDTVSSSDIATVTVVPAAVISVNPQTLYSSLSPDEQVILPLEIGNLGNIDLNWSIFEEPQVMPQSLSKTSPPNTQPASRSTRVDVLTSKDQCEEYENYAGVEPVGYAEICLGVTPSQQSRNAGPSLDPADIAYAQDIGFISDNFVRHQLNDFPGQIVVGQQSAAIFGYDFDVTGQILYAVNNDTQQLGTIDLNNGAFTAIGSSVPGVDETLTGLTIHPVTGVAYVSTTDGIAGRLYAIDLTTGALTLIGGDVNIPFLIDIAINPAGVMYGHDISTDSIYTIDVNTGVATLVGLTGLDANFSQGMDFDNYDGTLYAWIYLGSGANQYGTIDLDTGALTPLAIDDPLGEFEGATQTTAPDTFCSPSDIVWAAINPTSGTVEPGGTQTLLVEVSSTGMIAGTHSGTLCIDSNDFFNPILRLPITMVVEAAPAIEMEKTVGSVPRVCATTNSIEVPIGSEVTYCYQVFNTGNVPLSIHDLEDTELGVLLVEYAEPLFPGNSLAILTDTIILVTTTNQAIWTAFNPGPSDIVTATDSATVSAVPVPIIKVDPSSLASTQGSDEQVTLSLNISNLGVVDLNWSFFGEGSFSRTTISADFPKIYSPISPSAGPTNSPRYTGHSFEKTIIRDLAPLEENFVQHDIHINARPMGYHEMYPDAELGQQLENDNQPFDPSDIAYALDLRSDNFVWHRLDDFPGQTVVGSSALSIYGYDFESTGTILYALNNTTKELGTVNVNSGAFTAIGPSVPGTGETLTGLTIHPITNEAYVSTSDGTTGKLYSVNLATGALTLIGNDPSVSFLIDIAINPYGVIYGHAIGTDSIYVIDKTIGVATLVGPTGVDANFSQGMDFDNTDGTLYAWIYEGQGLNQYGTIDLSTGALTPLSIDNPLGEFEGATQTTVSNSLCSQPNSSWITVNPNSSIVGPGGTQTVDVTFDSTGLAAGSYHLILCIENNDPNNPLVMVPVTLEVESAPGIVLEKTVGLESMICAATSNIEVPAGTRVTYCYRVTNMGNATLSLHDLYDSELGILLDDHIESLLPGNSITIYADVVINETTTNQATWVSFNPGPVDNVYDIDTATVTIPSFRVFLPIVMRS